MSEKPYLGGRGIMGRTEQLNDRMWFWLLFAFLGSVLLIFVFTSDWPMPLAILAVLGGGFPVVMWIIAGWNVAMHTRLMNRETRTRGKGWADS